MDSFSLVQDFLCYLIDYADLSPHEGEVVHAIQDVIDAWHDKDKELGNTLANDSKVIGATCQLYEVWVKRYA